MCAEIDLHAGFRATPFGGNNHALPELGVLDALPDAQPFELARRRLTERRGCGRRPLRLWRAISRHTIDVPQQLFGQLFKEG